MKKKIKLNILGLSYSRTQSGAYALVLSEEDGYRRIPIIIGNLEAQSIAIKIEGLQPSRPLTHDLFFSFATAFGIEVLEVVIYKLEEGIFYSEIVCTNGHQVVRIDSRTSDAIAIALRFGCSIYTYEEIIDKSGIILEVYPEGSKKTGEESSEDLSEDDSTSHSFISEKSDEELHEMLKNAVEDENYELASLIQKELDVRNK